MAAMQAAAARLALSPPLPGARSPLEWGTEARVRELLGPGATGLSVQLLTTDLCGASPAARVEFNRTYVGPTKAIFDRLDPAAQQTLAGELAGCLRQFNRATDGTLGGQRPLPPGHSHTGSPAHDQTGPVGTWQQTRPGQPGQRTTKEAIMTGDKTGIRAQAEPEPAARQARAGPALARNRTVAGLAPPRRPPPRSGSPRRSRTPRPPPAGRSPPRWCPHQGRTRPAPA